MRRLLLSILGLCGLCLAGCNHFCSHGVCDCLYDNYCFTRSPWVQNAPAPVVPVQLAPAPAVPPPVVVPPVKGLE